MDRGERIWLGVLVVVFLAFNALTLSSVVPWQEWLLWSKPTAAQQVAVVFDDYEIQMPAPVDLKAGEFIEFSATSEDVTYGFGVFREDGTMVFQMQVVPGHVNNIVWKFDESGTYDVRSTEYSGPRHSEMILPGVIRVRQ